MTTPAHRRAPRYVIEYLHPERGWTESLFGGSPPLTWAQAQKGWERVLRMQSQAAGQGVPAERIRPYRVVEVKRSRRTATLKFAINGLDNFVAAMRNLEAALDKARALQLEILRGPAELLP